ncbi:MAG TPA: alpha/beta hydrolase [Candidatus Binatia bacterium]|nr:alpha/beta hydrolase [Candidatus Binatia bacterium]
MRGFGVVETVERKTLKLDGCTVSYLRGGSGTPLLFLHGANNVPGWLPFLARLAERHDVIVPDHPGFGASEIPSWLDNIHDLAYFYLDFIEELGLKEIHLIGGSLGGWLACEIAIRQTAPLRTLTLVGAAGIRLAGVRKRDIFLMSPEALTRALFFDQKLADEMLAQPVTEATTEAQLKNRYSVARVAWQPRLFDPHLAKWLHRIDVPTLLVWGDSDRLVPPAYAAEFARLIPDTRTAIIAQCGHLPQVEKPDEFLAAVTRFIEQKGA